MPGKIDKILTELGTNNSSQIATAVLAGFKMIFLPIATATDKNATPDQKIYTIVRDVIMEGLALITYIGVTGQIQKHVTAPICSAYYKSKAKLLESGKLATDMTAEEVKSAVQVLKKVNPKFLKEAGEEFLSQKSSKPKLMSDEARKHTDILKNVVAKINGSSATADQKTFDEYLKEITGRVTRKTSVLIKNDSQKATQNTIKILEPMKVFHNTRIALSQLSVWVLALAVIPPMCNMLISPIMKSLNKKLLHQSPNKPVSVQPFLPFNNKSMTQKTFKHFYNYFPGNTTGMRV